MSCLHKNVRTNMDQSEDELGLRLSEDEELDDNSKDTVDLYGDLSFGSHSERKEEEEQCLQQKKEKALSRHLEKGNNAQYEVESSSKDVSLENNLYDSILLSTDLEKYRKVIVDLQNQVESLKMQLEKAQNLCQAYDADNKVLLKNMSSLWKVAKADLQRSKEAYKKACKEQDALIFRRGMHQIPRGEIIRIVTQLGNLPKDDFKQFMEMLRGGKSDACTCQNGGKANLKGNEFYSPVAQKVNGRRLHPVRFSASGKPWIFTSTPKEETETEKLHQNCQEKIQEEEEENASTDNLKNINRNDDNVQIKEKSKMGMKMRKISSKRNDNVVDSVGDREQRYCRNSRALRSRLDYKKARGISKDCNEGKSKRQSLDHPDDHQYRAEHRQNEKDSPHKQETPKGRGRRSKRQDNSCEYGNKEKMMDKNENCTPKISENCEEKGTADKAQSLSSKKDIEVCNHSGVGTQTSRTSRRLFRHEETRKENSQGDIMSSVDNRSQEKGDSEETQQLRADMQYVRGTEREKRQKKKSLTECTLPCKESQDRDSFPLKDKHSGNSEWIGNSTQSASQKSNDVENLQGNNSSLNSIYYEAKENVGDKDVDKNNAKANMGSSTITEVISDSGDHDKDNQCYGKDVQNIDAPEDGEIENGNCDGSEKKNTSSQQEDRNLSKNQNGQEQEGCGGSGIPVFVNNVETSVIKTRSEDEVKTISESGEESLEEGEISDDSEEDKKKRDKHSDYTQGMSHRLCDDETRQDIRKKTWESNWRTRERWEKGREDGGHQDRGGRAEEKSRNYSGAKESKNSPSPHKSRRSLGKYREREKSPHRNRKDLNTLISRQRQIRRRAMSREKSILREYRRKSYPSQRDLGRERKSRESARDRGRRESVESRHRSPKKRKTPSRDSGRESLLGKAKEKSKNSRKDGSKTKAKSPVSKRAGLRSSEKSESTENSDNLRGRKLLEKEDTEKRVGTGKEKSNVEDTCDDTIDFLVSEHHKKYPLEVLMNAEDSESSLLQYIDTSSENAKDPKGETSMYTDQGEIEATSSCLENSNDLGCLEETLVDVDIDISCADPDLSFCDGSKEKSSTVGTKPADLVFQKGSLNAVASGLCKEMRRKETGDTSVSETKISKHVCSTEQLNIGERESQTALGKELICEKNTEVFTDSVSSDVYSPDMHLLRKTNKLHDITEDVNVKSDRVQGNVNCRTLNWSKSLSPVNCAFSTRSLDLSESLQETDKVRRKLDGLESGLSKLSDSGEELTTRTTVQPLEDLSPKNNCVNSQFREENQSLQDRSESEFCTSYSNSDSSSSSSSDSDSDSSCSDTDCNCSDSSSCDSSPDKSTLSSSVFSKPDETLKHLSPHHSPDSKKSVSNSVSPKDTQCQVSRPLHNQDRSTSKIDSLGAYVEEQTSRKRPSQEHELLIQGQLPKSHAVVGSRGSYSESYLPASSPSSQVQTSSHFRGIMDAAQPIVVRRKVRRNLDLSCSSSCSSNGSFSMRLSPFNANNVISIVYTRDSKSVSTTNSLSFSSPSVCTKSTYSYTSRTTHDGDSPVGATGVTSSEQIVDNKIDSPPRKKQKINSNYSIPTLPSTPEKDSPKPRRQNSKNKQTVIPTRTSPRKNLSPSTRRSPRKSYS